MCPLIRRVIPGILLLSLLGCGGDDGPMRPESDAIYRPIDPDVADFWDRQTTENADLLNAIADEFNANRDGLPLKVIQAGNYGDIYTKTVASIKARALPTLAVAYGNMTVEYADEGAVTDLDTFVSDPEIGIAQDDLDDFFPAIMEQNRYPEHDGALLSFPYTKAVLVMYVNMNVLADAGLSEAPRTWDAFLSHARAVKEKTGKHALCFDVDASTINGMIFSMGGEIHEDGRLRYDTPAAQRTFDLLETLFKEDLAYQNPPRTFNDQTAFGRDEITFSFRPSSSLPYYKLVKEGTDGWQVARLPQADPNDPQTVLYGANISVFKTTPDHMRAGWDFIKYFTSPEVSIRWALQTGYLPYRKSAVNNADLKAFWNEWPYNRTAFDCLPFARPEPNLRGWQQVRRHIENAVTTVITGMDSAHNALVDLQRDVAETEMGQLQREAL